MAINMLDCETTLLLPLLLGPPLSCCNMSVYPSLVCEVFVLIWFVVFIIFSPLELHWEVWLLLIAT